MGEKELNEEQKEELRKTLGSFSDKDRLALKKAFRDSLCNYLENQGAAFSVKSLEKRLESFIEEPNERKYGRENLEETLNKLRAHGRINSSMHDGVTHYFVPKQPPKSTNQTSSLLREPLKMQKNLRKSEAKISSLYQAAGFFSQEKMKMIQRSGVHFVDIYITTNGFEFIGTSGVFPQFIKSSTGYHLNISWSNIKSIKKTKERIMHVIIIETYDTFYTILPLDPQNMSSAGISSSKKNANDLIATINKAQTQVQAGTSRSKFCTNCGESIKPDSDFCGNCGHKFS